MKHVIQHAGNHSKEILMPDSIQVMMNESLYKIGRFNFVFRWSIGRKEWLKSEYKAQDIHDEIAAQARRKKERAIQRKKAEKKAKEKTEKISYL